jgi:hypothetical protein
MASAGSNICIMHVLSLEYVVKIMRIPMLLLDNYECFSIYGTVQSDWKSIMALEEEAVRGAE